MGQKNDPLKESKSKKVTRKTNNTDGLFNDSDEVYVPRQYRGTPAEAEYIKNNSTVESSGFVNPYENMIVKDDAYRIDNSVDLSKYEPYIGKGTLSLNNIEGANNLRADMQSGWAKAGNAALNAVGDIIPGIIEDVAGAGEFLDSDQDYSNVVTEWAKEAKGWLGGDIYMREGETDYYSLVGGLLTSVAQFGIEGAMVGGLFAKAGKGIGGAIQSINKLDAIAGASRVTNMINKGGRVSKVYEGLTKGLSSTSQKAINLMGTSFESQIPQLATATALSYVEARIGAADAYKKTFEDNIDAYIIKFGEEDGNKRAKTLAREVAKTRLQFGMLRNIPLNLTGVKGLFRNESANLVKKFGLGKIVGETEGAFLKRTAAIKASKAYKSYVKGGHVVSKIAEPIQEGVEELNDNYGTIMANDYATSLASKELGIKDGKSDYSVAEAYFNPIDTFKQLGTKDGIIAFVSGAVMGGGQSLVMDMVPRRTRDAKGNIVRITNEQGHRNRRETNYDKVQDALVGDVKRMSSLQQELMDIASKNGKSDRSKEEVEAELFDITKFNAVTLGIAKNHISEYEVISKLDNKDISKVENEIKKNIGIIQGEATKVDEKIKLLQTKADNLGGEAAVQVEQEMNALLEAKKTFESDLKIQQDLLKVKGGMTEAQAKGYSNGVGDDSYIEKAKDTAKELEELDNIYNYYNNVYGHGEDGVYQLPAALLEYRMADITARKILKQYENTLEEYIVNNSASDKDRLRMITRASKLNNEVASLETLKAGTKNKTEIEQYDKLLKQTKDALSEEYTNLIAGDEKLKKQLQPIIDNINTASNTRVQKIIDAHNKLINTNTEEYNKNVDDKFNLFKKALKEANTEGVINYDLVETKLNKFNSTTQQLTNGKVLFTKKINKKGKAYIKAVMRDNKGGNTVLGIAFTDKGINEALKVLKYKAENLDNVILNINGTTPLRKIKSKEKQILEDKNKKAAEITNKLIGEEAETTKEAIADADPGDNSTSVSYLSYLTENKNRDKVAKSNTILDTIRAAFKGDKAYIDKLSNALGIKIDIDKLKKSKYLQDLLAGKAINDVKTDRAVIDEILKIQDPNNDIELYKEVTVPLQEQLLTVSDKFRNITKKRVENAVEHDRLMTKKGGKEFVATKKKYTEAMQKELNDIKSEVDSKKGDEKKKENKEKADNTKDLINDTNETPEKDIVSKNDDKSDTTKETPPPKVVNNESIQKIRDFIAAFPKEAFKDTLKILDSLSVYGIDINAINELKHKITTIGESLFDVDGTYGGILDTPNHEAAYDSIKGNINIAAGFPSFVSKLLTKPIENTQDATQFLGELDTYLEQLEGTELLPQHKASPTTVNNDMNLSGAILDKNSNLDVEEQEEPIDILKKLANKVLNIETILKEKGLENEPVDVQFKEVFRVFKNNLNKLGVASGMSKFNYLNNVLMHLKPYFDEKNNLNKETGGEYVNIDFSAIALDKDLSLTLNDDLLISTEINKDPVVKGDNKPYTEKTETDSNYVYDNKRKKIDGMSIANTSVIYIDGEQQFTSTTPIDSESANLLNEGNELTLRVVENYTGNFTLYDVEGNKIKEVKWGAYLNELKTKYGDKYKESTEYIHNVPIFIFNGDTMVGALHTHSKINPKVILDEDSNIAKQRTLVAHNRMIIVNNGESKAIINYKSKGIPNIKVVTEEEANIDTYEAVGTAFGINNSIDAPLIGINKGPDSGIVTNVKGKKGTIKLDFRGHGELTDMTKSRAGMIHPIVVDNEGNKVPLILDNTATMTISGTIRVKGESKKLGTDLTETIFDLLNALILRKYPKILPKSKLTSRKVSIKDRVSDFIYIETLSSISDIPKSTINARIFSINNKYYLSHSLAGITELDDRALRIPRIKEALGSMYQNGNVDSLTSNSSVFIKEGNEYKEHNYNEYLATRIATNVRPKIKKHEGDTKGYKNTSKEGNEVIYFNNPVTSFELVKKNKSDTNIDNSKDTVDTKENEDTKCDSKGGNKTTPPKKRRTKVNKNRLNGLI